MKTSRKHHGGGLVVLLCASLIAVLSAFTFISQTQANASDMTPDWYFGKDATTQNFSPVHDTAQPGDSTVTDSGSNENTEEEKSATSEMLGEETIVTLNAKGGVFEDTGASSKEIPVQLGASLTQEMVGTVIKPDASFMGWETEDGTKIELPYIVTTPNLALNATWQDNPGPIPPTPVKTGWVWEDTGWRYYTEGGSYLTDGWQWVVDDVSGHHWYYFFQNGFCAMHEWIWDSAWYYIQGDCSMACGTWNWIGNAWYGFNWNGTMCTGWIWDGTYGSWFYCYSSGEMASYRWIDGYWLKASGACGGGKVGWQNPAGYYPVSCWTYELPCSLKLASHYYVTPSRISANATREECINAFLARAREYVGTPYRWDWSDAPGAGVDCSGLVYQCAYACGMDMGEFNPYNHWIDGPSGWHSHDAQNLWNYGRIARIALGNRMPGDLIFWPGHVAIYMGNDQIIEAFPGVGVHWTGLYAHGTPIGVGRLFL